MKQRNIGFEGSAKLVAPVITPGVYSCEYSATVTRACPLTLHPIHRPAPYTAVFPLARGYSSPALWVSRSLAIEPRFVTTMLRLLTSSRRGPGTQCSQEPASRVLTTKIGGVPTALMA